MVLDKGEIICPECKGYCLEKIGEGYEYIIRSCPKCRGTGTLDWIEQVVGKKPQPKISLTNGVIPVFQTSYYRKLRGDKE